MIWSIGSSCHFTISSYHQDLSKPHTPICFSFRQVCKSLSPPKYKDSFGKWGGENPNRRQTADSNRHHCLSQHVCAMCFRGLEMTNHFSSIVRLFRALEQAIGYVNFIWFTPENAFWTFSSSVGGKQSISQENQIHLAPLSSCPLWMIRFGRRRICEVIFLDVEDAWLSF